MEQKTEASQAVDELEALAKRLDRIHTACTDDRPKQAVGALIHAMINMPEWDRVRAALKAQPAPTEAQGDPVADFIKWIESRGPLGPGALSERIFIAGWYAGNRAAQGAQLSGISG